MQINWFTVLAQVINFLILVWLLKRYLYKPILKAIDEREARITSQLNDADAKKAEAKKEQDEFIQKNVEFDTQKEQHTNDMLAEAKEIKHKLLEEARSDADALRNKLETTAKEMQESASKEIALKAQQEVFAIARKTLRDLASVSLEEQSVILFLSKLKELQGESKQKFIDAFKNGDTSMLVQSTFELTEQTQHKIIAAINDILGAEAKVQFKTSPKLVSGIELTTSGYKLAWSISEYLKSLEQNVFKIIKVKPEAEAEHI